MNYRYKSGWQHVKDLLDYHERGNGLVINNKYSYDIDQAVSQIARGERTWNGVHVTGKEACFFLRMAKVTGVIYGINKEKY
ncbi:hypothetical protein K6D16_003716 [Salmonella enterica]|nr:hypothetical protein [Salmonella enterica]